MHIMIQHYIEQIPACYSLLGVLERVSDAGSWQTCALTASAQLPDTIVISVANGFYR